MSLYKELDYNSEIYNIKALQFGISSPEEIRRKSVCHVTQPLLYDSQGEPVINGLFDPRMGVLDHGKICPTDELDNRFCPGYFGHIELQKPVFSYQFMDVILKTLKCYCLRCSSILLDKEDEVEQNKIEQVLKLNNKKRWAYYYDSISKNRTCVRCGFTQPSKFTRKEFHVYAEWKETAMKEQLSAERVHKIFKKITVEDCNILGFTEEWCRPHWLICTVLPVAPGAVRPSIKQPNGTRSEDDITHKYVDIIKTNDTIRKKLELKKKVENKNTPNDHIAGFVELLQYHVATLIDNEIPNINVSCHRSGRPLKTFVARLKGKEGRIRGNLMGKRVDYSARTVITPDPNIRIDQLGVPFKVAMNLTFPEIVNRYNIHKLTMYVRNGPFVYPGAKSYKKKSDSSTISLQYVDRNSIVLEFGDVVHRHLIDDDNVLFNRQPSLHKMSMMAHKVKVMKHNTFRLNVSVTKPYNADFDGDEMNMHVPQSIPSSIELRELARVPSQIISPRSHAPVISPVQDTLLGIYRITNDGVYFNEKQMMELLITVKSFDGNLPEPEINQGPYRRWSGRQLLSIILPPVNLNMANKSYNDSDGEDKLNYVKIRDGIITQGRFDKDIVSKGTKGLVHMIFNDFGEKRCQEFLDNIQDVITRYLLISGFSVGISDLIADSTTKTKMGKIIVNKKKEVSEVIQHVHLNIFKNEDGKPNKDEFESKINNILQSTINQLGKLVLSNLDKSNRMENMVASGSKGSNLNISQMISCLGQQNVDGKRIPYGFIDRSLPHFLKYDDSPEGRGFVENSFIGGLSPQEFFFHAMGGREGLIDTAVKTSETGYIQRKLIKAMEDLKVDEDLTVKNSYGKIIQFKYGDDGYHYGKIESQKLDMLADSFEELEEAHRFMEDTNWEVFMTEEAVAEMEKEKNGAQELENFYRELFDMTHLLKNEVFKHKSNSNINYPINLERMIKYMKNQYQIDSQGLSNLNPVYVYHKTQELADSLKSNEVEEVSLILKSLLYSYLSPKKIVQYHRLSQDAFEHLVLTIQERFRRSYIPVGEMVGPIAAQSIGEPATQMTLNTFHFAGISSKSNVTRGVPRLKELLHISKNIKQPSVTIYLKDDIPYDRVKTQEIANKIELTILQDVITSSSIYFDPPDQTTSVEYDSSFMDIYKVFEEINPIDAENDSCWVLRLEFDRRELMNRNITMEDIHFAIFSQYEKLGYYSDDNAAKLILRIRLNIENSKNDDRDIAYLKNFEKNILNLVIKGVDKINKISIRQTKDNVVYENGNYKMKEMWVLDTVGTNLIDILGNPYVDSSRTYSNDVIEVYNVLGIDAAKKLLMKEINEVIDFSGNYVNSRHIALLTAFMTNKGLLMSVDRFGINRDMDIGPLAKCSFEETTDQIFKAGIFGDVDNLDGVSANIMMGQVIPCGTGHSQVLLDEMKLLNIKKQKQVQEEQELEEDTYCANNLGIDFDINAI